MGTGVASLILAEVEALFECKQYSGADRRLRSLEPELLRSDPFLLGRYHLLKGKIAVRLGADGEDSLNRAISIFRPDRINAKLYGEARLWKGALLQYKGKFEAARDQMNEAVTWFHSCNDLERKAVALNSLAYVLSQLGNGQAAETAYFRAISIYHQLGDKKHEQIVGCNLAYLYIQNGDFQKGLDQYLKYPLSTEERGEPVASARLLNMAIAFILMDRLSDAREVLAEAEQYVGDRKRDRLLHLRISAQLHVADGEFLSAHELLSKALAESSGSDLHPGILRWLGHVELALNHVEDADRCLRLALDAAEKNSDRCEIAATLRLLADLHVHAGNFGKAKTCYSRSLHLLTAIGSKYELAITQISAAMSGAFGGIASARLLARANKYLMMNAIAPPGSDHARLMCFISAVVSR